MACASSPFRALPFTSALLLAACSHLSGSAGGALDPAVSPDVEAVAPDVVDVRSLGEWRYGDRFGTYRVITRRGGVDRVQTTITIEWLSQGLGEASPTVVASQKVGLLEELGPIAVAPAVYGRSPNRLTVSVQVRNTVTGEAGKVTSTAQAPGQLHADYLKATGPS